MPTACATVDAYLRRCALQAGTQKRLHWINDDHKYKRKTLDSRLRGNDSNSFQQSRVSDLHCRSRASECAVVPAKAGTQKRLHWINDDHKYKRKTLDSRLRGNDSNSFSAVVGTQKCRCWINDDR